jgi:peptidoglycan/LPS O-acetylase OafA/YrhL
MRRLAAPALLAVGAATGLATAVLHERWWGLLLGAAATALALRALPAGWWTRLAFSLGWCAMLLVLSSPRPEGDYAVGRDVPGYLLLGLGLAVLVIGLVTLPAPASLSGTRPGPQPGGDRRVGP